jgi:Na+-driven multidrug efflux pump
MRKAFYRIGIPTGVESLLFSVGKLITQTFIASLGTVALAGNFAAGACAGLSQLPGSALAIACTTLVGQAMGRGDAAEAKAYIRDTVLAGSACLVAVGLVCFPLAPWLSGLFTQDPAVNRTSTDLLRAILVVGPFLWATSFLLPSGLRGAGDTRYPMVVTLVGMWLFRIGLGWVFAFPAGLGVMGVWLAMFVDWLVRSVLFLIRLNGESWQKQEVHPELTPAEVVDRE